MARKGKLPTDVKALARVHTETALKVLAEIMNDPSAPIRDRTTAAAYLVARVHGTHKPLTRLVPDQRVYYVYSVHVGGKLVYIGKGCGKRRHISAAKIGGYSRIRAVFPTEMAALLFEARLIRVFKPVENIQHACAS